MIDSSELKRGQCIHYKGQPMIVVDVSFSSPTARGGTTIARTRLRNLLTQQLINESIRGGERFEEVDVEQHPTTYMYSDGTRWHFMDQVTYDQFDLGRGELGDDVGYLKDGLEGLRAMLVEGRVVSLTLPNTVDLQIIETDPAIKGATATSVQKPAKLETGMTVLVPPYLENGELIRIDTRDGHFVERAK